MLVLNKNQVEQLLPEPLCMEVVTEVMKAVSRGDAIQPMRQMIHMPDDPGMMGWMPGYVGSNDASSVHALGMKLVSIFPVEGAAGRSAHQGLCILFNTKTGLVDALIEAGSITAIRTPCATAVATRALARENAKSLTILGPGEQGRGHLSVLAGIYDFERICVWGVNQETTQKFAASWTQSLGVSVDVAASVEEAVADADIVCTTTAAPEPILQYQWLKPGAHVNVIGSSVPFTSEIDIETVSQSSYFVDHRETVQVQGGDYLRALKAGAINEDHIEAEVGEVLLGQHPGRKSENEITVYKSVGIVAYDLAAAQAVYNEACLKNSGQAISLFAEQ